LKDFFLFFFFFDVCSQARKNSVVFNRVTERHSWQQIVDGKDKKRLPLHQKMGYYTIDWLAGRRLNGTT
jgi:hypothetical protein